MPTVIDSLIVTLGLDPTGFTKGQKEAAQAFIKTKTNAASTAKEMEARGKQAAQFFSQVRNQALLLFATVSGGRGFKQFFNDLTNSNAAIGRMAVVAGTTASELARWRGMVSATGGDANSAAASINGLNQSLVKLSLTGESDILPYLRALQAFAPKANLSLQDANGNMRTAMQLLPELHKAVQGMDAARATAILTGLGLGQDVINVLIASDKEFNKFMQDQKRWGTVTEAQAKGAQRLQYSMAGVSQSFETLGRIMVQQLGPYLERVNQRLTDLFVWFQSHPKEMEQAIWAIVAAVTALALVFGGPIAIIGVLTAAVALLYNDWLDWNQKGTSAFGDFWQFVIDGWNKIESVGKQVWQAIDETVGPVIRGLVTVWLDWQRVVMNGLKLIYQLFFGTSDDIKRAWGNLIGSLKKTWSDLWDGLGDAILNAAPKIYDAVKHAFGQAFSWAINRANTVWRALTGHDLIGGDSETSAADKAAAVGPGSAKLNPADRAQQEADIQHLMGKGWSREAASGIVGNLLAESSGDIKAQGDFNKKTGQYDAYGLAQWHPDRQANFKKVFGKDIRESTRQEQLDFVDWELRNSHKGAGDALKNASSAKQAAHIVMNQYEMPAERTMNGSIRGSLATNLMTPPAPGSTMPTGAPIGAAANSPVTNANKINTSSTDINIREINIKTNATDALGLSSTIEGALNDRFMSDQANYGQR